MKIPEEKFAQLIQRLEIYAKRNPNIYKIKVGLLAILGYGYIFAILAILIGISACLIWLIIKSGHISGGIIKLIVLAVIPIFIIINSLWEVLWLRFPTPQGLELKRQEVPNLFKVVEELADQLKCPQFYRILVNSELNASVQQLPINLLGQKRNYLIIGLPLLQSLSAQQFCAVLAHELGHISGNHSIFAGWIYRMRYTWGCIYDRLEQLKANSTNFIFNQFFNWYIPFFNAYSFVLARANEYEADRCAVQLIGDRHIAAALVNIEVKANFLDSYFWQQINQLADEQPDPPNNIFTLLGSTIKNSLELEQEKLYLKQALGNETNYSDTHPCLSDRLTALGINSEEAFSLLQPVELSAAEYYLDQSLIELTTQLNQDWQTIVTFKWRERYSYVQQSLQELQALNNKAKIQVLTIEEAWSMAQLTVEFIGIEVATPLLHNVLKKQVDHVPANYLLGRILIAQENSLGIKYLEKAMEKDPETIIPGCQYIYKFLRQQGKESAAEVYRQKAEQYYRLIK
jgi:Zn-dependent protease with chaperone function